MEETKMNTSIVKFYENKELFITGGSGFIGKALIEKLLRSCPGIRKIYVLIRAKKGKNPADRLSEILKNPLFNRLREEQPDALNKVEAIAGDCFELGVGISPADLKRIANVSIIYHSAASVRFDEDLRDAILLNTRGTCELLKIAEQLKNLKAFIHISTTFCNATNQMMEERVYESLVDWRTTIKLAETYNRETLNIFNLKYSNHQPNTYTFTKSQSENLVNDYRCKLPLFICRPSIVVSTLEEPIPGWSDNFYGPIGMLVASGIGILRTTIGNPNAIMDFVPVDIVVRVLIIAAYKRGLQTEEQVKRNDVEVINCATANICPITMNELTELGKKCIKTNPFEKTVWVPGGSVTLCPFWHILRFVFVQLLMAVLMDCALFLAKEKPFLLRLQRKILSNSMALKYFVARSWDFKNDGFTALQKLIPDKEINKFGFMHYSEMNYEDFFQKGIRGAKQYLLHESPISSKGARIRMKIYQILHLLFQLIGMFLISRLVIRYIYNIYYN